MLSELTKKGILTIKGLLDECKAGIEQTNKDLEVIDEKYRKLIAEEKKTLKSNLTEYKAQLKQYEKMFATFDSTAVKEVLGDFESSSTEEEEPTVFDTVYPENNETEEPVESATEADAVSADSVSATAEVDAAEPVELTPEQKEAEDMAMSGEPMQAIEEEKQEIASVENSDVAWPVEEEKEVAVITNDDNGWPDFPEDWK